VVGKSYSIVLFTLFHVFVLTQSVSASSLKKYAGVIQEISADRMVLDLKIGSHIHIGYSCDAAICSSTSDFLAGDYVIAIFGSVDRKNKLLSLRLCSENIDECNEAEENQRIAQKNSELDSMELEKKMVECRERMQVDLEGDERFIGDLRFGRLRGKSRNIIEKYDEMRSNSRARHCARVISDSHLKAFLEACERNNCGDRIGGGCHHLAMTARTELMMIKSIEQCN